MQFGPTLALIQPRLNSRIPLRENKNHNTAVEASNYIAALYALRSVHGDINESQILKLSEVSDNSLLVFQDNDLSLATGATSEGILHASGVSDNRMESGLTGARAGNDNTYFWFLNTADYVLQT